MSSETTYDAEAPFREPPRVTVVVPLFNGADHLYETLTSIERQSLADVEAIVVDDGSDDDGVRVARNHPLCPLVVEQQHLGVAVARNRGLALARGRWVTFLDQDDLWHPDHLRRAVQWLDSHPGERIVFAKEIPFTVADEAQELRKMDELAGSWAHLVVPRLATYEYLLERANVEGSPLVARRDLRALLRGPISVTTSFVADPMLLRLAGGFAPHALAMDDYWLLVNVARLQPIVQLDQPTVFYRVHVGATSRTTQLGLPFLSSAAALRLGGGLIDRTEGLSGSLVGKLHAHLLRELIASSDYRDAAFRRSVDNLARLIWPPHGRRRERARAHLAARVPWARRTIRSLRGRLRSDASDRRDVSP